MGWKLPLPSLFRPCHSIIWSYDTPFKNHYILFCNNTIWRVDSINLRIPETTKYKIFIMKLNCHFLLNMLLQINQNHLVHVDNLLCSIFLINSDWISITISVRVEWEKVTKNHFLLFLSLKFSSFTDGPLWLLIFIL